MLDAVRRRLARRRRPIVVRVVVTAGLPSDVRAFVRVEFVRAIGSEDRSATNADAGPMRSRAEARVTSG
jgi:hypothetical protein